jgi:cytoskeletal protein CcmA (bactofilin family)
LKNDETGGLSQNSCNLFLLQTNLPSKMLLTSIRIVPYSDFTQYTDEEVTMAISKTAGDVASNVIGENSYFTGTFIINGSLRIDGRFEGKYLQADQLYVGRGGKIKTNINAVSVIVEGLIIGNINASSRILLMPTAKVYGDIKTPELIIQNGVVLEGRCTIANDLRSTAKDLIESEYERNKVIPEEFLEKRKTS